MQLHFLLFMIILARSAPAAAETPCPEGVKEHQHQDQQYRLEECEAGTHGCVCDDDVPSQSLAHGTNTALPDATPLPTSTPISDINNAPAGYSSGASSPIVSAATLTSVSLGFVCLLALVAF